MTCIRCQACSPDSVRFCPACGSAVMRSSSSGELLSAPEPPPFPSKPPPLWMFRVVGFGLLFLVALAVWGYLDPPRQEITRVSGDAICTSSAGDLEFATRMFNRGDESTVRALVKRGRATRVGNGTEVSVIRRERDEGRALVKLETGSSLGTKCWLPILESQ